MKSMITCIIIGSLIGAFIGFVVALQIREQYRATHPDMRVTPSYIECKDRWGIRYNIVHDYDGTKHYVIFAPEGLQRLVTPKMKDDRPDISTP